MSRACFGCEVAGGREETRYMQYMHPGNLLCSIQHPVRFGKDKGRPVETESLCWREVVESRET